MTNQKLLHIRLLLSILFFILQRAHDDVDATLGGEGDAGGDADLKAGVHVEARAHQQLADQDAGLDLRKRVADAGARAVAEGEEAVLGGGEVHGFALETLGIENRGVLPDGGISAREKEAEIRINKHQHMNNTESSSSQFISIRYTERTSRKQINNWIAYLLMMDMGMKSSTPWGMVTLASLMCTSSALFLDTPGMIA